MIAIQLIGIVIALAAIYLTYIYYKRQTLSKTECLFWVIIWLAFITVTLFPRLMAPLAGFLSLQRSMDLIMIIAFVVLFTLSFYSYVTNRRTSRQMEKLVREFSLQKIKK